MTVQQVCREINRLRSELFEAELAIDFNQTVVAHFGDHVTSVTWAGCSPSTQLRFATLGEHSCLLRKRQFTVVLFDGALLQMSYKFRRDALIEHRLCFYPFPLQLEPEEREAYQEMGLGLLEILESFSFSEFRERLSLQSPIRFDYDVERASGDHAASHVHLLRSNCRIPVFAPLSTGHFIQFVFRRFYPEQWAQFGFLASWPCRQAQRTVTADHERQLYLNRVQ